MPTVNQGLELPTFGDYQDTTANVRKRSRTCLLGDVSLAGRIIALATWDLNGELVRWTPVDESGRRHGTERELEDGRTRWQVRWVKGVMHGLARQFSVSGKALVTSRFISGMGVDVYCDDYGQVCETRVLANDLRHGVELFGPPSFPIHEGHYSNGLKHGVFRDWKPGSKACEPPAYFLNGIEVQRDVYRNACRQGRSLPPDRRVDDQRKRAWPAALFATVKLCAQQRVMLPKVG